jgi:hypothetical protein
MFEGIDWLRYAVVFVAILALLGGLSFAVRWFRLGSFGSAVSARGRQPRLGVTEFAAVGDGRRRLLLIRRDNVEHLVMTGGPTDVVIESNIVRAIPAAAVREPAPARVATDTLPRPVPLAEGGMWPLQPEPIARAQRAPAPVPEEPDEDAFLSPPPEPAPRAVPERESVKEPALRAQGSDRLSGLAADLSRNLAETPAPPAPRRTAEPRRAPPQPVPAITATEEQNLADMAQRLESALQRPRPAAEPAPVAAPPVRAVEAAAAEPVPARPEPPPPKPAPKPATAAAFDSLEQEMASLLGRPPGKT